jgi:hypothetical protein
MEDDRRHIAFTASQGLASVGFNAACSWPHTVQNQAWPLFGKPTHVKSSIKGAKVKPDLNSALEKVV